MRIQAFVAVGVFVPATVFGQAWLPQAGDGAVSVIYQNQLVRNHLLDDGGTVDAGHIKSDSVLLDFTYGLTDKLALNINLPFIETVYHGVRAHPGAAIDDGRPHGTLQDFRLDVRYNVRDKGIVLTPFVDLIVPSHEYPYYGHAAPGRRLGELQVGTYVGRVLARGLHGAFVQGRLSYGFTQQPLGRYHDRSNADVEFGYFINPKTRVFAVSTTQYTFGGVALTGDFPNDLTKDEFRHHDQLARSNLVDVGGGVQYQVSRRMTVMGSYIATVVGRNGHALGRGVSIGVSWGFGRSLDAGTISRFEPKSSLPKCICQKGISTP
jgi:hypothetical protein